MFDPKTKEGDYAEAYHKMYQIWKYHPLAIRFNLDQLTESQKSYNEMKKELLEDMKFKEWLERQL